MTKLFRTTLNDSWISADGIGHFTQWGTLRIVDGTPMVQRPHGLFPADGWHSSEQAAHDQAADRIAEIGRRLLAQAEAMRQGAVT